MTGVLLKKQLRELFRTWFYDPRSGAGRTRAKTVLTACLFLFGTMLAPAIGVTALALAIGEPLYESGAGWLYFTIMGVIALVLGVIISAFTTFSGLYLGRDNDLLLSLPIPVPKIVLSRVLGVYLMGLFYSGVVTLPAAVVWCCAGPFRVWTLISALLWVLMVSLLVLELSCLLGYFIALLNRRLKNRSFLVVLIALAGLAAYYLLYFKAMAFIRSVTADPAAYGAVPNGGGILLWWFGRAGEGDGRAILLLTALLLALGVVIWRLISRSFLGVVSAAKVTPRTRGAAREAKQKTPFAALVGRELGRFTASANYMLNCGLGTPLLAVGGVALLWKGGTVREALFGTLGEQPGVVAVLVCAAICVLCSMNDMATPSVALEGKSFWVVRSLPVDTRTVLRSKLAVQLLLTALPALFCALCGAAVLAPDLGSGVMMVLLPLAFAVFNACLDLRLGLWRVDLNWTAEVVVIKQSLNVLAALFTGDLVALALLAGAYALSTVLSTALCLALVTLIVLAAAALLYRSLMRRGMETFEQL